MTRLSSWQQTIIEQFSVQKREKIDTASRSQYFFPNDVDFFRALSALPNAAIVSDELSMLLVGDSYLLSSLPLLVQKSGAKTVFICDIDPELLSYIVDYQAALIAAENEDDFLTAISSTKNAFIGNEKASQAYLQAYVSVKERLGANHCFHSNDTFLAVKAAYRDATIIPVCINLFDKKEVETFASLISGHISLLNLTNLREWDKEDTLSDNLNVLPFTDDVRILFSSHRERFGFGPQNPTTTVFQGSMEAFHKTAIENILFPLFIRRGNQDEAICQEILRGINHINTRASDGYTPLEMAIILINPSWVRLLLKHGASIPLSIMTIGIDGLIIKNYTENTCFDEDNTEAINQIKRCVTEHILTQGLVLKLDSDTVFQNVYPNTTLFVNGSLTVLALIENKEKPITIMAKGDISIRSNCHSQVNLVSSEGHILLKNIAPNSLCFAKKGITAESIGRDSRLLAGKEGKIIVHNTDYGVSLSTSHANIEINIDPPHAGVLSIEGPGKVTYHLESSECSAQSVEYNLAGHVVDRSKKTWHYARTQQFLKFSDQTFSPKIHASSIMNVIFQWARYMHTHQSMEETYTSLLTILDHTPKSFMDSCNGSYTLDITPDRIAPLNCVRFLQMVDELTQEYANASTC